MCELTETFVRVCEQLYSASPTKYLTLSSFAEKIWTSTLDDVIEVPDMDKQHFIGLSVYGGRTYPCRKRFESKFLKLIHSNKSCSRRLKKIYKYVKKEGDYIFNGDVNSMYPSVMASCELLQCHYPTGISEWVLNDVEKCKQIFTDDNKLGIFEIEFECTNKKILHPILPRKKTVTRQNGQQHFSGVEWSLNDGKGVYNTIDIQNAIKHGYKITFTGKCLYWKTKTDTIFKSYIDNVYQQKVDATNNGNKVKRQITKLMMNSIFGKTLQRPMSIVECIARTISDVEEFLADHILTDWVIVEKTDTEFDYVILTGEKINEVSIAKKPRHLGSFVLSYSRRLWLMFIEAIDPSLTTQVTTYLDTDSAHIFAKHYQILLNKGMIDDCKLGFLSNDCDNDAIIVREINLSPKCYMYETIDKDGNFKTVMKSKGIIHQYLQNEWYINNLSVDVSWTGLKKINKRVTSNERANGITPWSIKTQNYNRTFNLNEWTGMQSDDNYFYPFGYDI